MIKQQLTQQLRQLSIKSTVLAIQRHNSQYKEMKGSSEDITDVSLKLFFTGDEELKHKEEAQPE